jgi:hypothetical protein
MAKKIRTGFELPFSNATDQNYAKSFANNTPYLFNNLVDGFYSLNGAVKNRTTTMSLNTSSQSLFVYSNFGRTKIGTRGTFYSGNVDQNNWSMLAFDLSQFANGFFANYWLSSNNSSSNYLRLIYLNDSTDFWTGYIDNSGTNTVLRIEKNGVDQSSYDLGYKLDTIIDQSGTWYNTHVSVDNSGVISISINGSTAFTYATGSTFSSFTQLGACMARGQVTAYIDDLAINDGSGSTDNAMPNSIRAYNFFDQATLDSQSGFSTVGGSTILANLTDGDDSTRVTTATDLSEMNFSLPSLSSTGMSETASNFSKIEAINIYARQIEATKANSVLKAKITDSVTNANREENISLPLTVANDSTTMFDDGSNDFSLSNLDSGNLDLKITFDKQ